MVAAVPAVAAGATPPARAEPDIALVIVLLQMVGLAAGFSGVVAAVRTGPLLGAVAGWLVTFAPVCAWLLKLKLIGDGHSIREPALFALASLAACLLGVGLGRWIYRESETASERANATAHVVLS
jgi:hypothetical protein